MLTKISSIRGTDAFDSFEWLGAPLKRFNLLYGWNGSGKTTASRVLTILEKHAVHLPDMSAIEFTVATDVAGNVSERDLQSHAIEIRVFNKDFVEDNLAFDDGVAKRIVILGEANIQLQREIDKLAADRMTLSSDLGVQESSAAKNEKIAETALTSAGRDVTQQFTNTPLASDAYYGRSYNKTKVERVLAEGAVTEASASAHILEPNALDALRVSIKTERTVLPVPDSVLPSFKALFEEALGLLTRQPKVASRSDLLSDSDLRDWAERGYHLHTDRSATECLFCGSQMDPGILEKLAGFFTEELNKLKEELDAAIDAVTKIGSSVPEGTSEASDLFPDLVLGYQTAMSLVGASRKAVVAAVDGLIEGLERKRREVHESVSSVPGYPVGAVENLNAGLRGVADSVKAHNQRAADSNVERVTAAKQIEHHAIAKMLTDKGYFEARRKADDARSSRDRLKGELTIVETDRAAKQAALQNTKIAVDKINILLAEFFGESQLYLEPLELAGSKSGYGLRSRGKTAKRLSEGEKSVLALIYFLVKLDEAGCDKKNCVVVIDDPVDSQDSVFLFQAFGLLTRRLNDVGQAIVFTHSFEFFNLLRDWLAGPSKRDYSQLFMMTMDKTATRRVTVADLPRLLKDHKSEYQYLFSRLHQHVNGGPKLEDPLVANVARKVLEYFSGFKWSCRTTEQFTNIVLSRFVRDQNQLRSGTGDFIVKFLHEHSHGQDFGRSIAASTFEAEAVAKNVLTFIREADKEHFDDLAGMC